MSKVIVMKRVCNILCVLAMVTSPSLAWADADKLPPSKRFKAQLPADGWKQMDTTAGLKLRTPAKVEIYLKIDNDSLILVRSGRLQDFGISPFFTFSSDDAELVYLMKLVPDGDYIDEVKLNSQNPLLEHAKAYSYKVQDKALGSATNLAVMLKGKDTVLIELLATPNNFDKDSLEFYKFLDNLKEH